MTLYSSVGSGPQWHEPRDPWPQRPGSALDSPLSEDHADSTIPAQHRPEKTEILQAIACHENIYRQLLRVEIACNFAEAGHAGQKRDSGADYVSHPYGVALILIKEVGCTDINTIISALIHDMPEDSPFFKDLIQKGESDPYKIVRESITRGFGVHNHDGVEVAEITLALTKLPKSPDLTREERLDHHIKAIWSSAEREKAVVCKECDVLHNLRTIDAKTEDGIARVLDKTKKHYIPLFEAAQEEHPDFWGGAISKLLGKIRHEIAEIEKRHPQAARFGLSPD